MKCPVDGTTLIMADRSGVEIDYCPQCRGVWLDRGELDKIIERSAGIQQPPPSPPQQTYSEPAHQYTERRKKKSRGLSLLEDIFDF